MIKLLRAGCRRYVCSPLFWVAVAASVAAGTFAGGILAHLSSRSIRDTDFMPLFFICAILVTLSIGREFSDGIFRNKLVCGHTKGTIYWSEMILAWMVCGVLTLLFMIALLPWIGEEMAGVLPMVLLKLIVGFLLSNLTFCTFFGFVGCLVSRKAIAPILCLMVILLVDFQTSEMVQGLNQPEFYYEIVGPLPEMGNNSSELSEPLNEVKKDNPFYVGGAKREIYERFIDISPSGQLKEEVYLLDLFVMGVVEAENMQEESKVLDPYFGYSLLTMAGISLCGWLIFRKKNMK